jgi:tetratricopeptide (TPR) repeat protein
VPVVDDPERAIELADEALVRYDVDALLAHLSTAIRGFTARGEHRRAAMACVRLGDLLANAMGNLTASRAWFNRAARLVADEPPCVEQGWVAVAAMGCDVGDPDELLAHAELALDRARRFGDVNLETKALADAGLAHVQAGRLTEGFALLDEAMALACGPADDTGVAGKSACSFFTACYYAADFERAGSWAELLRRHGIIGAAPGAAIFLSNHCDSVQATLLCELGRWGEAEQVLTRASAAFEAVMPVTSWHPALVLADLRIRQGRYAEAEALLLGKDQAFEALLPAARLHLARGEHDLARATALRGLRALGVDRLRAAELLTVLVDVELAGGDLDAARAVCADLEERTANVDVAALRARTAGARARVTAAASDRAGAAAVLESTLERVDLRRQPWLRACLLLDLARLHEAVGDRAAAVVDAKAAAATLAGLDVTLRAADAALLERLTEPATVPPATVSAAPTAPTADTVPTGMPVTTPAPTPVATAELSRDGRWWTVGHGGTRARLPDTKGLRYLAELIARPGAERHALDLVDRVEGTDPGIDRRALGDAGPLTDARARAAYRRRIEALRGECDDRLAAGDLDGAEQAQADLDELVGHLARAFGLGGRDRRAASAAERARLNVTRAVRAAIARISEAVPDAGAVLDRRVRTGLFCRYEPAADDAVRWVVAESSPNRSVATERPQPR